MKKNYEKPLAKKVTFNYQKVVASSGCYWWGGSSFKDKGCTLYHGPTDSAAGTEHSCGYTQ